MDTIQSFPDELTTIITSIFESGHMSDGSGVSEWVSRRDVLGSSAAALASMAGCSANTGDGETTTTTTRTSTVTTTTPDTTTQAETTTEEPTTEEKTTNEESEQNTKSDPESLELFNGEKRVFVANGYSTSHKWPVFLQRKIDRYFGGKRVIAVDKVVKNCAPIARWMDVDSGTVDPLWEETLTPAVDREYPVVVLAQQTLYSSWGPDNPGIEGPSDNADIERGADVFERYTNNLVDDGADLVYLATHIYKNGSEPIKGNERLALAAVLERDIPRLRKGPDVWEPTKANHPEAFATDNAHPSEAGSEIMAHYWFKRLLQSDDREVPSWSKAEMQAAIENADPGEFTGSC